MRSTKNLQKSLIERFSENNLTEDTSQSMLWNTEERKARRLDHFLRTAEMRKRQILEKMLME